jgi:16S rRNA processing protein RimM
VRLSTDYPEHVNDLTHVYIAKKPTGDGAKPYAVSGMRMNKAHGLLRLEDIDDRDQADRLRQLYVLVRFEDAVALEDDEFYLFQVIGMTVQTQDGYVVGTVKSVMETGANDVYVVDSPDHGEVLFPITVETLVSHDIEGGIVWVNLIDGLLPN